MNYCRRCGMLLRPLNEHSFECPNGHTIYSNPSPTVGVFLLDSDDMVLLSVRGQEPNKGTLDCFGGFLDGMESFENALERELREETGLEPADYSTPQYITSETGTYDFAGETHVVVSNFYYATLSAGSSPKASDDVASIRRVKLGDIEVNDIGNQDVKKGFVALRDLLSARQAS